MTQSKKGKVLHIIETSGPGGAEKVLLSLVKHTKEDFEPVVALIKEGWLFDQLLDIDVHVRILSSSGAFDSRLIREILKVIREEQITLVHSHLLDMNFYSSIAAKLARVHHICTEHGDIHHPSKRRNVKTVLKAIATALLSEKVVFVSDYTRRKYQELIKLPIPRWEVIYNGYAPDGDLKQTDWRTKREEIGVPESSFLICNVANLYKVKGHAILLKAMKEVVKFMPMARLVLCGRGPEEQRLKALCRELGLERYVKFLGFREDVNEILQISDLFVLASFSEGLPMALIEAMSYGVPVVATNVGGVPELVRNGITGLLVPSGNIKSLVTSLTYIYQDSATRTLMGKAGKNYVTATCAQPRMISEYMYLYVKLGQRRYVGESP